MLVYPKLNPFSLEEINITEFMGVDDGICADKGSFYYTENISAEALPKLTARNGRINVFSAASGEKITGLFSFDKVYVTTERDGITEIYCGDEPSDLTHIYTSKTGELATSLICKAGSDLCVFNLKAEQDGKNLLVAHNFNFENAQRVSTPHFNDVIVYKNRLFGCGGWKIFASAYNEITNWDTNEERIDIEAKAFERQIKSESDFTACTVYKGHALFFTADEIYKLGGKDNSNFELVKIANYGCVNRRAICEAGGVLYFVSKDGIVSYDGSRVWLSLDKLCASNANNAQIVLCGKGNLLYLNTETQNGRHLYGINTKTGGYVREDEFNATCAVRHDGTVLFADSTDVYKFNVKLTEEDSGNDAKDLSWHIVTQDLCRFIAYNKRGPKLEMGIYKTIDNLVKIFASYDGGDYEMIHTISGAGYKDICIPLTRNDFNSVRFKISGYGETQIHYIKFVCNTGADACRGE